MSNLSMNDRIRLMNADLSNIDYIVDNDKIYFKESQILDVIESTGIQSAEDLCAKLTEDFTDCTINEYCLICDDMKRHTIGLVSEYYMPIASDTDPVMESFSILQSIEEGTDITTEAAWVLVNKLIAKFKKGDYKEAGTIEYRLNKCKNELEQMNKELKNFQNNPNKKTIQAVYTIKSIIKSVIRLGVTVAGPIVSGKVGAIVKASKLPDKIKKAAIDGWDLGGSKHNPRKIGIAILRGITDTISASQYELYLKRYIAELNECVSFLENEKKEAEKRDKDKDNSKKAVKESDYINPKSISDIVL